MTRTALLSIAAVAAALLFVGCNRFMYEIEDFTPRPPKQPNQLTVLSKQQIVPGEYGLVVTMVYGGGWQEPTLEEALAKFREKAASLGCDALLFGGRSSATEKTPAQVYWKDGQPYYTGQSERTSWAWSAAGLARRY